MGDNFDVRLLKRSVGATRRNRSIKTLYGDKTWVDDLDIVNELGAHTGCVNALRYTCIIKPCARNLHLADCSAVGLPVVIC